jgi:hypothetical protein
MRRLGSESRTLLGRLELDPRVTVATGILKRDSEESRLYDSDATGVVFQTVQSSVPTLAPVSKFSQNVKVVLSYRAHASLCALTVRWPSASSSMPEWGGGSLACRRRRRR